MKQKISHYINKKKRPYHLKNRPLFALYKDTEDGEVEELVFVGLKNEMARYLNCHPKTIVEANKHNRKVQGQYRVYFIENLENDEEE